MKLLLSLLLPEFGGHRCHDVSMSTSVSRFFGNFRVHVRVRVTILLKVRVHVHVRVTFFPKVRVHVRVTISSWHVHRTLVGISTLSEIGQRSMKTRLFIYFINLHLELLKFYSHSGVFPKSSERRSSSDELHACFKLKLSTKNSVV